MKPVYREDDSWLLPGGKVELDETPLQGCRREIQEELGQDFPIGRLLLVEYQSQGMLARQNFHFVFDGAVLTKAEATSIRLPENELCEYRFCDFNVALELLHGRIKTRVRYALKGREDGRVIYLEDGMEI